MWRELALGMLTALSSCLSRMGVLSLWVQKKKNGRRVEKKTEKTEVRKGGKTKYSIEIKRKCVSGVSIWGNSRGQRGGHSKNKNKKPECWVVKEEKHTKVLEGRTRGRQQ